MHVEIVKNEGQRMQLKLKEISVAMANALRRSIVSDLEAFAVDEVDFYENNSAMFNEYIANRLAMIPLTCEESHADKTEIALSLNAEGPCMVYSRDLKSSDETIKVFNENIPIIKLGANQKLRLEAKVAKGSAKRHSKFQCALASYSYEPSKKNPEYHFIIESYNNIPAEEHLMRAIAMLNGKTEALLKSKELK
ncbi:MAG: DNA-directed RNA polymerase subunit D [Candidatus Micrarchaeota archaeon]